MTLGQTDACEATRPTQGLTAATWHEDAVCTHARCVRSWSEVQLQFDLKLRLRIPCSGVAHLQVRCRHNRPTERRKSHSSALRVHHVNHTMRRAVHPALECRLLKSPTLLPRQQRCGRGRLVFATCNSQSEPELQAGGAEPPKQPPANRQKPSRGDNQPWNRWWFKALAVAVLMARHQPCTCLCVF